MTTHDFDSLDIMDLPALDAVESLAGFVLPVLQARQLKSRITLIFNKLKKLRDDRTG
jgi:hypothetical protein